MTRRLARVGLGLVACAVLATACRADVSSRGACEDNEGSVRALTVDVEPIAPAGSEEALLWLPACADIERLQIVILMHGAGLSPATWFEEPIDVAAIADRLDRADVDTAVLAPGGADGNQFFIDHTLAPLLEAVEAEMGRTVPVIGLGGYSAGGPTVARLAFGPDRIDVSRVGVWAPVWGPQYLRWIEDDLANTSISTLLLDAGADDGLGRSLVDIADAADASGADVEVTLERPPGGHNMAYVASRIDVWLPVLAGVELVDVAPPSSE